MGDDKADRWMAEEARKEAADRLRKAEPRPTLTREEFLAWRGPRVSVENPTPLNNPLWHWLVRTQWDAYHANELFGGPSAFDAGPMWCFDRFGSSETELSDGRIVHIAGEHEDCYDPDFCIFNDVTIVQPDGAVSIYGYPVVDFPPTDFHTATLVGDAIIVIGNLGYPGARTVGVTPVYRLALDTMRFAALPSAGESPGWISRHSAHLSQDGRSIEITGGRIWRGAELSDRENLDSWLYNIDHGSWTRSSTSDWQQWTMFRVDRKRTRLWDVRQELWHRENPGLGLESFWRYDDAPDFDALTRLYRLTEADPEPEQGDEYNVYRIACDGTPVRFREDGFSIEAVVEGRLSESRVSQLKRHILVMLERLDLSAWEIEGE